MKGNTHTVNAFRRDAKYEVITCRRLEANRTRGEKKHKVILNVPGGTCSCQKPQLTGIPCSHLLAACANAGIDSNQYVTGWHDARNFMATWAPEFAPFDDYEEWPRNPGLTLVPHPALYGVKKGRRQRIRIRTEMDDEDTHTYRCGICGQQGHSRRTCRNTNVENTGAFVLKLKC